MTFFNTNLPADWMTLPDFQTYNPNYVYPVTDDQRAALTPSVQNQNQLIYSVNGTALTSASAGSGEPSPNILGAVVTLIAADGIGKNGTPTFIPLNGLQFGTLTAAQEAVVAQATAAGDVLYVEGTNSAGQTVQFPYGQPPAGVTPTGLEMTVTRSLYVSVSGVLNATSGTDVNIAQTSGDLTVGQVSSTSGAVNLSAAGNILNQAASSNTTNVTSTSINLTAGGSVGVVANPLPVTVGDGMLNVSAQTGVYVTQTSGNLNVGQVSSTSGTVSLTAPGSILNQPSVIGFGGNGTGWTTNSNQTGGPTIANDVLTLINGKLNEARSAWFDTPVPTGSFTASFTYTDVKAHSTDADGIAFVLQNDSRGTAALGSSGGSLGYGGVSGTAVSSSAAFEISIYNLSGNTQGSNFVTAGSTGSYKSTGPVNFLSGDPIDVSLIYDASAETVTEMLSDTTTGVTFTTTYKSIDLATVLGNQTALLGFTGGSGGDTSTQTISNFAFSDGAPNVPAGTPSNVSAPTISLTAQNGSVGTASIPLPITVAPAYSMPPRRPASMLLSPAAI